LTQHLQHGWLLQLQVVVATDQEVMTVVLQALTDVVVQRLLHLLTPVVVHQQQQRAQQALQYQLLQQYPWFVQLIILRPLVKHKRQLMQHLQHGWQQRLQVAVATEQEAIMAVPQALTGVAV